MFVHVPGILHIWLVLLIPTPRIPEVHFFQLFYTFKFDQKNYGIYLALLQLFNSIDIDIQETVLVVSYNLFNRPQCCALKMTSPFLVINEYVVRNTLNNQINLCYVLQESCRNYTFSTVFKSLFIYSGRHWTYLLGWSLDNFSTMHPANGPRIRTGLKCLNR